MKELRPEESKVNYPMSQSKSQKRAGYEPSSTFSRAGLFPILKPSKKTAKDSGGKELLIL